MVNMEPMAWVQALVIALICAGLALLCDVVVQRWFVRLDRRLQWREGKHKSDALYLFVLGLQLLSRFAIWAIAILVSVRQIPQLQPLAQLIKQSVEFLWHWIIRAVNLTLIDLGGGNRITLITLFAMIGIAILIFFGANVLGRWIKQKVLSKTRIERGSQEAISALISYIIAVFGLIILLQSMGVNLSSLTVFAGVIGIGFGLGLQELAKNFVSGLTLLFEQQLRVGDFVEVDGLEGTIEAISIRSTIIRTQDRLYVVVPNHRFFEKNVINWSYKTPESRIHIPVNVAYGTDTLLLTEALIAIARGEPKVLRYPSPQVWFKGFGDSALEFELLVWINQPHEAWPIKSSIYFAVEQELKRRNITVPFPQRELWVHHDPPPLTQGMNELSSDKAVKSIEGADKKKAPMPKRNLRHLLRGVSYFQQCTNAQLLMLIEQGFRHQYHPGEIIFREHEVGECFYLILSGQVEIFSEKLNQSLATLSVGEFFGEISVFTGVPRSATVKALEETTLFVVDRRALTKLMQDYNELAERIAHTLAERQQVLDELGLGIDSSSMSQPPVFNIRNRIKTLFGI